LGGTNMPPEGCFFLFEGMGAWFPVKFPNNSNQVLIKFLLFPSTSQPIPIKFLLVPSITHQNLFVPINFSSNSFCSQPSPI
jgi:hypothetical protein